MNLLTIIFIVNRIRDSSSNPRRGWRRKTLFKLALHYLEIDLASHSPHGKGVWFIHTYLLNNMNLFQQKEDKYFKGTLQIDLEFFHTKLFSFIYKLSSKNNMERNQFNWSALLARAVVYADCTSTDMWNLPTPTSVLGIILNCIWNWVFNLGALVNAITPRSTLYRLVVHVKDISMDQIEQFSHQLEAVIGCLKLKSHVKIIYIT